MAGQYFKPRSKPTETRGGADADVVLRRRAQRAGVRLRRRATSIRSGCSGRTTRRVRR
ncbi:MAG: hypothetical protein V9G10_02165 [Candidatus Nanopelagicales bacterium]